MAGVRLRRTKQSVAIFPVATMSVKAISPDHERIVEWLKPKILPWRKMTIAIDGVDGSGKSTLSRFLAWQLGMPVIETDLALVNGNETPSHDIALIERLIKARHNLNRPVIVEGVFVLSLLEPFGVIPEILIRIQAKGISRSGSWPKKFKQYNETYPRSSAPDYDFNWVSNDDDQIIKAANIP